MNTNSNFGKRTKDPELQVLVEQYLSENWQLSYISIEDMIEKLQSRSFRYSRMKKQAFASLVHKAYEDYCRKKTSMIGQDSGQAIASRSSNISPQKPVEDIDVLSSDSDIEEIEEQAPRTNLTNNQLSNMYGSANKSSNNQLTFTYVEKSQIANQSTPTKKRNDKSPSVFVLSSSPAPITMADIDMPTSTSTIGSRFENTEDFVLRPLNGTKITEKDSNPESDNDLEIIEEVSGEKSSGNSTGVAAENRSPKNTNTTPTFRSRPPSQTTTITSLAKIGDNRSDSGDDMNNKSEYQHQYPKHVRSESMVEDSLNENRNRETFRNNLPAGQDLELKRGTKRKSGKDEPQTENNRKKLKKEMPVTNNSKFKLEDFAGSESILEEICKLLMHLKHPEVYKCLGVTPPRGFLLHGPPGCGKTLLANAIAGELEMPLLKMAATELVSGVSGESESNIRDLFNQALSLAPCIVFIDEIDAVTPKRETAQREMERRIVAQLLACIDDLGTKEKGDQVLLIGATNRIEAIDTGLRRAGRFDREICLGIPNVQVREKIIRVICRGLRLEPNFDFELLSKLTPGYVGADLQALTREAAVQAVNKVLAKPIGIGQTIEVDISMEDDITEIANPLAPKMPGNSRSLIEKTESTQSNLSTDSPLRWIKEGSPLTQSQLDELYICMDDFIKALKNVQPSSKREGFATVPDITWDDVGALQDIRDELQVAILGPVKHAAAFLSLGLNTPAGSLLCGPPGVGKTLLAKAVANEAGINFISVKGPELLNMYVGESERAVRQCFNRARNSAPCVIFFDELDALCPRRSEVAESGSGSRIVNQLLTEMDGMESRLGVFVMAATNRPDIIDPAILRPGRLDKIFFVDFPSANDRLEILKAITKNGKKPMFSDDVNLQEIACNILCENYTGADLAALVREASIAAFRELVLNNTGGKKDLKVSKRHFDFALSRTRPSVSKAERDKYEKMKLKFSSIVSGSPKQLFLPPVPANVEPTTIKSVEAEAVKCSDPVAIKSIEIETVEVIEPMEVETVEPMKLEVIKAVEPEPLKSKSKEMQAKSVEPEPIKSVDPVPATEKSDELVTEKSVDPTAVDSVQIAAKNSIPPTTKNSSQSLTENSVQSQSTIENSVQSQSTIENSVQSQSTIENSVEPAAESALPSTENPLESKTDNSIDSKIENSVASKIENSVESKIENSVDSKIDNSVDSKIENSVESKIEKSVESKTENSVESKIENSDESKTEISVDSKTENIIASKPEDLTEDSVQCKIESLETTIAKSDGL